MLIFVQAVDKPRGGVLTDKEFRNALHIQNLVKTGYRIGLYVFYRGMRQRLTTKLSAKYQLVQDASGVCKDIVFHADEFIEPGSDWRDDFSHPAWQCGFVVLKYLPTAVLLEFEDCDLDVGYGRGVVAVEPSASSWKDGFRTRIADDLCGTRPETVAMTRYQVPLAPYYERTVHSSQGLSMDATIFFLKLGMYMSLDDFWLHVYVMIVVLGTFLACCCFICLTD